MSFQLILHLKNGDRVVAAKEGQTILEALAPHGDFHLDAPCGGLGKCGKCLVTLRRPGQAACRELACRTMAENGMELWPESSSLLAERGGSFALPEADRAGAGELGLAVDLGTTTVAASLFDLHSGLRLAGMGEGNAQRRFGADVLSRISFDTEGEPGLLTKTIRVQLADIAKKLCAGAGRDTEKLRRVSVAGNTVMEHFLAGLSAKGLGAAPFSPESLFGDSREIGLPVPAYLAPCPAGYVGGDITAGLAALEPELLEGRFLFIDAGTNGEMVLGEDGKLTCCATAVGPAFEGAEIRCGMSGAAGAIDKVFLDEQGALSYTVIGGGAPVGICGSGLIDALAVMLRLGAVSESGRLFPAELAPEEIRDRLGTEDGEAVFYLDREAGIFVSAGDVRRLQLAKAAVRAGAETLLSRAEKAPEQILLAGGFGSKMNADSALVIGMLPQGYAGRIRAVGNSALAGAERLLLSEAERKRAGEICARMRYFELSGDACFSEAYMEAMSFDEF